MSWFHSTHRAAPYKAFLSAAFATVMLVLLVSPSKTAAQDVGDRVRVFLVEETLIGQIAGIRPDGFQLDMGNGLSRSVLRDQIRWLERDVATGSNAIPWGKKGFLRGAMGGAAVGFLLGLAVGPDCRASECNFTIPEHLRAGAKYGFGYAGIGGLLGGATGLILGSMNERDEWQVIPVEGAGADIAPVVGLRASPGRGVGVVVGVRLRF